tara:strand:+ start:756 stop:1055 length:300 start_codon:yes stop_codon:yes gene_type:complete
MPLEAESFKEVNCNSANTQYEMNICSSRNLYKNDSDLKKEIGNDDIFQKWLTGREAICEYYSGKNFEGGSIRPMMQNGCNMRLNSEAKRFCLTGDPQCG